MKTVKVKRYAASRWLIALAVAFFWPIHDPPAAHGDDLMQKIEKTGVLRIGFQEDVAPFSYYDAVARLHRGFSVDMAHELVVYLSKRFKKNIRLQPINLTAVQRLDMIRQGMIDAEMGASTQTCERERQVDFSLVFFSSETTFLVKKSSGIQNARALDGRRIAAGRGTTNLQLLDRLKHAGRLSPGAIVPFDTHNHALRALTIGQVDAYCADRVLLATKRLQTPDPAQWVILEDAIGYEPYAFMIPEGNSDFRDFVNDTIRWSLLTGKYYVIYEKWMGPSGLGPYKMPISFKEYLNVITYPMTEDWWQK